MNETVSATPASFTSLALKALEAELASVTPTLPTEEEVEKELVGCKTALLGPASDAIIRMASLHSETVTAHNAMYDEYMAALKAGATLDDEPQIDRYARGNALQKRCKLLELLLSLEVIAQYPNIRKPLATFVNYDGQFGVVLEQPVRPRGTIDIVFLGGPLAGSTETPSRKQ